MATASLSVSSFSGYLLRDDVLLGDPSVDWANVINATTADVVYTWQSNAQVMADTSFNLRINRLYLVFDTSSIPPSSVITSISLKLYVSTKLGDTDFKIYKTSSPTLSTTLQASDYNLTNFSTDYGDGNTFTVTSTGSYDIILSPTGSLASDVKSLNELSIVFRSIYDYDNIVPPGTYNAVSFRLSQSPSPYISVTYTTGYGNKVDSILNMASVNGVSKSNISKIDGI